MRTRLFDILLSQDPKIRRMVGYWAVTKLLYWLCAGLLWVEVALDVTPIQQAMWLSVFLLIGPFVFYVLIRLSTRLALSAAQLAIAQALYAELVIAAAYAITGPMRGVTICLLLLVLVFCAFALSPQVTNFLSAFSLFLLGVCMLAMSHLNPQHYHPAQEAVHFIFATSMLVAVNFLTSQFTYLRRRLSEQKTELGMSLVRVQMLATKDELTQLPNRTHMREILNHEANRHKREAQTLCVGVIDLDQFSRVNASYGYSQGDVVLCRIVEQALASLRVTDVLARWGGEEFLLLMPNTSVADARFVMNRMRQQIAQLDFPSVDPQLRVTFSGGLTTLEAGDDIAAAMIRLDNALQQAKLTGRNVVRVFDAGMELALAAKTALKNDLFEALRCQQFRVMYQPQMDASGKVVGAEALLRWDHPQRGNLGPAEFIPLAEEMGLIVPLGEWILQTACQRLASWRQLPSFNALTLSVNVSARQFAHHDFSKLVMTALSESGACAEHLMLELTESMLVDDAEDMIVKMQHLKACGVQFSLDDFGTGYSSLSYLKQLPIDELKIDQSFVRDVETNPNDATIACAISTLANSLGLHVIAEGVESEGQRAFLMLNGCARFQGYLFSRPLSAADFDKFVTRTQALPV